MSHYDIEPSMDSYDVMMRKAIGKIKDNPKTKILKEIVKEESARKDPDRKINCQVAEMVFRESLGMYREGELSWEEFTKELHKSLKAL